MIEGKTLFGESFYKGSGARTQEGQDEGWCPWSQEVQNFKKQPIYKQRQHAQRPQNRRYTSQLESYSPRPKEKEEPAREYMLPYNSVTISYGTEQSIKQQSSEPIGKDKDKKPQLRLPSLIPTRRSSLQGSLELQRDGNWGLLGQNRRSSLKRYTSKLRHGEGPPQFQIYKRSLIAARKFVLGALSNPEASLQFLQSL